ncbi:hypothetical protein J3E72DRAFT_370895 [Bipolaris maydis]|uniref:Zn(2)-C6 fungal-type domain-containing protein n=1 Tax=Cochliobolus carbonum (strain 26-R-13) TaxID=930089 RepID=W6YCS9_COCC2|nr:uncharacterized protein COCCADRAFT_8737 [Bipolaris zeicola 26-R-13]EUC28976.1 hypothetical protein COCCADRAFT_8737 [Bipolaris zeicola 26-R-13]KAI1676014.1 Fungal specific transcription factor domain protein [Pyrenophora tritici-repentis]KAJ6201935.1 hypothetical protein J3E72DRAFT_370895 [Bipolaris maydis]
MKRPESGEKKATRQCWECLKRRLVCDHTLPHCKKCVKAGKECPGYDQQKPLQWVEHGKVTSRRRKRDGLPKVYTIRPRDPEPIAPIITNLPVPSFEDSSNSGSTEIIAQDAGIDLEQETPQHSRHLGISDSQGTVEAVELYKNQLAAMLVHDKKAAWWHSMTTAERNQHITNMAVEAAAGIVVGQTILRIGSQKNIKAVVERGQAWEAAMLLQSDKDPLKKLKQL